MSAKWNDVGTIRIKRVEDESGNPVLDDDGNEQFRKNFVFDRTVKIMIGRFDKTANAVVDFKEIDLGKYRTAKLMDPMVSLNNLKSAGYLDDNQLKERVRKNDEKGVKYSVLIPPDDGNNS